jgi:cellulose biosynthesis protein BcsQ
MLKYNKDALINILINEFQQNVRNANDYANDLKEYDEVLQKTLIQWLKDRTIINDIKVNGVTVNYIITKRNCKFIDALGFMNFYLHNPEKAKAFKETPESYFYRA